MTFQRCKVPYCPPENQTIELWPWRDIIKEERRALAYRDSLPRCTLCGKALMLGQQAAHFICLR